jgi:hypothetical protein
MRLIDRPHVLLDGLDCARIAGTLRRDIRAADRARLRVEPATREVIHNIESAAAAWLAATSEVPRLAPSVESAIVGPMSTAAVAEVLRCSPANVAACARRGSIHGVRTKTGWVFDPVAVAEYVARRSERAWAVDARFA